MGAYQQKCQLLYNKSVVYKPNFYPKSLVASSQPLKSCTKVLLNLLFSYLFEKNFLQISSTQFPSSPKLQYKNVLRNYVSIYEIVLLGIQKCTQNHPMNKFTTFFLLMVFLQGINIHILLNLSTTMNRQSYPFLVVGKPPTKSMEIISHGRVDIMKG